MKSKLLLLLTVIILIIPTITSSYHSSSYYPYHISYIEKLQPSGYFILNINGYSNINLHPDIESVLVFRWDNPPWIRQEKKLIAKLPLQLTQTTVTDTNVVKGKTYYYFLKTQLKNGKFIGYSFPISTKKAVVIQNAALANRDWQKDFKLVCDEPCEIAQKSLDDFTKVAALSFKHYKELLNTDVEESIKPIEIHIEPKGECGDPWGAAYSGMFNGKGLICLKKTPFIWENGKKVLHPNIRLDEPMSVLLHEFTHLVLWDVARSDNKLGWIEESFAQNIGHYAQNPVINGNYCDAKKWNSPTSSYMRFMYELCQQTGFNTQHLKQFFALAKTYMKNSAIKQRDLAQIIKTITGKDPTFLFDAFQF